MARNAHLSLRVRPILKAKLEKLAELDRPTLSSYLEMILEDHVKSTSRVALREKLRRSA
jgi:hypothetical protein